jgi:hypothetical protein
MNETIINADCKCIVYHPVGEEYQQLFMEWTKTGRTSAVMAAQLFSTCHSKQSKHEDATA